MGQNSIWDLMKWRVNYRTEKNRWNWFYLDYIFVVSSAKNTCFVGVWKGQFNKAENNFETINWRKCKQKNEKDNCPLLNNILLDAQIAYFRMMLSQWLKERTVWVKVKWKASINHSEMWKKKKKSWNSHNNNCLGF